MLGPCMVGSDINLHGMQVRVVPASETLFSEFIGTHLYHPAPSCMWEPLARLKRLTIIVEHGATEQSLVGATRMIHVIL